MKIVADEAIVIGMSDYRETDKIVQLFTKGHGRMSGVARGARKSVKRFGGALELFAKISLQFVPAESLVTLNSAEPFTIFPGIRTALDKIANASYAVELVSLITAERVPNRRLYRLLCAYLDQLDVNRSDSGDRHFFEMNLLNILGYRPHLDACSDCGRSMVESGGYWRSSDVGAIRCTDCASGGARISGPAIVKLLSTLGTGRFGSLNLNEEERVVVADFLESSIGANISRPLRSAGFLRLYP